MNKSILAIILLAYSVFGGGLLDTLDITPKPVEVAILEIDTPTPKVLSRVEIFSEIIKDQQDRQKIAIFNYEFAKRVGGYETTSQQINDVYSLAGKLFFNNSLVGKYENLAEEIVNLMKDIISDENHSLTEKEKSELSEYFYGVSWVLIQKG
jgi:hypothetical protein